MNAFMKKYLGKKGQGIVEYALLLAFVVAIATTALSSDSGLGQAIKDVFNNTAGTLTKQAPTGTGTGK